MDRATAFSVVSAQCASTIDPVLPDTAIYAILDAQAGLSFTTWAASTAYAYGALVVPTVRNGHTYKAIVGGTSGTSEPFWPLYSKPDSSIGVTKPFWHGFSGTYMGSTVGDGSTTVWQEAGPDNRGNPYDLRRATYDAWLQKAAIASSRIAIKDTDETLSRDQVIDHCLMMAKRFMPTGMY